MWLAQGCAGPLSRPFAPALTHLHHPCACPFPYTAGAAAPNFRSWPAVKDKVIEDFSQHYTTGMTPLELARRIFILPNYQSQPISTRSFARPISNNIEASVLDFGSSFWQRVLAIVKEVIKSRAEGSGGAGGGRE